MIVGFMIDLICGLLCIAGGLMIWKKQKISLLHDYHYRNVEEADIPAYTRRMGIGLILVGLGCILTGVLHLFDSSLWWIPMSAGFVSGLFVLHKAQMKYNGSWFG